MLGPNAVKGFAFRASPFQASPVPVSVGPSLLAKASRTGAASQEGATALKANGSLYLLNIQIIIIVCV